MDTWVFNGHFLASQAFPKYYFRLLFESIDSRKALALENPCVTALSVGSNADVAVEAKANKEIAEQHGMVLGVTAPSSKEALHGVPYLYLVLTRCFQSLERYQ